MGSEGVVLLIGGLLFFVWVWLCVKYVNREVKRFERKVDERMMEFDRAEEEAKEGDGKDGE